MFIGNKEFDFENNAYVMGILNVTPDSFSDGGRFNDRDRALKHTEEMIRDGASIIDVGGESTRPGYTFVSDDEEIERTADIISEIKKNFDVPVSLDTYKSRVAAAGISAGADMINDIWGLKYDNNLADVIAKNAVSCVLMHNRNLHTSAESISDGGLTPATDINLRLTAYRRASHLPSDIADDVINDLRDSISLAKKAGISDDRIILDPGIGFGKTYEMNLEILKNLSRLNELEFPILLGTSRKSVIGLTLNVPASERTSATVATTVIGLLAGCRIFRVHDVKENMDAIKMTMKIFD